MKHSKLIDQAISAMGQAYCPYSKYPVGAALLAKDGSIYTGCNIENSSYGLTSCAERSAFSAAISNGAREFEVIAIVTESGNMPYPCGACLQVMSEFCEKSFMVITALANAKDITDKNILGDLLQSPFTMR